MKRVRIDLDGALADVSTAAMEWHRTTGVGLDVEYGVLVPAALADELFGALQDTVDYYEGHLAQVKVFGKWHQIPRQQAAYGDDGLKYRFSGISVDARPWTATLSAVRNLISRATGFEFNFVLINRYRNGNDHIGEHRDNEDELDGKTPIASLSLGQKRDFILRHASARKAGPDKLKIKPIKIELEHGSLLLMKPPTNQFWYHSVPPRKKANGIRINLTFRKINMK